MEPRRAWMIWSEIFLQVCRFVLQIWPWLPLAAPHDTQVEVDRDTGHQEAACALSLSTAREVNKYSRHAADTRKKAAVPLE